MSKKTMVRGLMAVVLAASVTSARAGDITTTSWTTAAEFDGVSTDTVSGADSSTDGTLGNIERVGHCGRNVYNFKPNLRFDL